jgi:hypothetical protein
MNAVPGLVYVEIGSQLCDKRGACLLRFAAPKEAAHEPSLRWFVLPVDRHVNKRRVANQLFNQGIVRRIQHQDHAH